MRIPLCFFVSLLVVSSLLAERVSVTLLATTDLHGNIYPVDYFTGKPVDRGLAKLASLIRQVREENPNTLLIDNGDTIQGAPIESLYQQYVRTGRLPLNLQFSGPPLSGDPMMLVMNHLGFEAMVLGNHEFNFGLRNLEKARAEARFPWLSANTEVTPGGSAKPFEPYLVKTIAGVKVAVIGITTPAVSTWEKPENYGSYRFQPGKEAAEKAVAVLRSERPDVVVASIHAGLDRDLKTGQFRSGGSSGENMVYSIAAGVPGIDAIVFGHTHQEVAGHRIGDVLLVQPKNWGISMARLDFVLEREAGQPFKLVEKRSRLLPAGPATPADPEVLRIARPYHELTERYLDTQVATSPAPLSGALGRVEDSAVVDAVHAVQLHFAKADVSFTALFNPRVEIRKGPLTVREIVSLYVYDNDLYAVEGTGKTVKDALENAARYFISCQGQSCSEGPLTNPRVLGFNYDMAQGVGYEIDLTRPEGDRIQKLQFQGQPLLPHQRLRIAINNYRAAGSAGYSMFRDAKVVWRSSVDMRDLMMQYFMENKTLRAQPDHNWRIVPREAAETLKNQALKDAARPQSQ